PPGSTFSAVVSPTPPGHAPGNFDGMFANCVRFPAGVICSIVVPVPWSLALSLKLLTRKLPACSVPVVLETRIRPYGLTSPFAGTVDPSVVTVCSRARSGPAALVRVAVVQAAAAVVLVVAAGGHV